MYARDTELLLAGFGETAGSPTLAAGQQVHVPSGTVIWVKRPSDAIRRQYRLLNDVLAILHTPAPVIGESLDPGSMVVLRFNQDATFATPVEATADLDSLDPISVSLSTSDDVMLASDSMVALPLRNSGGGDTISPPLAVRTGRAVGGAMLAGLSATVGVAGTAALAVSGRKSWAIGVGLTSLFGVIAGVAMIRSGAKLPGGV